jgi:allophanate hydrolase
VEANEPGTAIQVEVWEMPVSEFGSFVACIPVPLGIGTITLASGEAVQGFLCEQYAITQAVDISRYGGWRAYLKTAEGELIGFGHDTGTRPTRVPEK